MSTARQVSHTYQEYLAIERDSAIRHEFSSGEIYALGGGTPEHAALIGQVMLMLARLFPQCRVLPADLRVRISESDVTTYPDVSVMCGPFARADEDALAVTNPRVLVEVTSPSTEAYDRGAKLSCYKQLPSLQAVLIVSHREPRVTVCQRTESTWVSLEARGGAQATFEGVMLDADELYAVLKGL
jgi:Uma2 family endonuclease